MHALLCTMPISNPCSRSSSRPIRVVPRTQTCPQSAMPSRSSWRSRRRQSSSKNVGRLRIIRHGKSRTFHGSWTPSLISSTNWISRPWPRPPSKQSFRFSLPSRPARLLILLHLNAARRPQLHRQAWHLGPSLRARQAGPPVPALECRRACRPGGTGGAEAIITYVRQQNRRGDTRHPSHWLSEDRH
jgi:hypothetical protein